MLLNLTDRVQFGFQGELEFIIRDRQGRIVRQFREPNLVKIFAKEMLAHRLAYHKVWDPEGGTGSGAWVATGLDTDDEFAIKYILLGASFDEDHVPLDSDDDRYYTEMAGTGTTVPIRLGPGADYDGELINAIPISEPGRPLKKIERIYFETSYQPAGTPLLQSDVRAINNILVVETVLRIDEYNGFGLTSSDYFTITEVALAGGRTLVDDLGACECKPREIFLQGHADGTPLVASSTGTDALTLDGAESAYVDLIKEGDQIKIVAEGDADDTLDQITPFYLVLAKDEGSYALTLDRAITDSEGNAITGNVGVFRDGLRIFSHRILRSPLKKADLFEITIRWRLLLG